MLYDVTKNNMWHLRKTRSQDKIDMDWQREAAEYLKCGKPQESQTVCGGEALKSLDSSLLLFPTKTEP